MDVKRINDDLSVSPQIAVADLDALAAEGFRAVICNRPDGEVADQPTFEEIKAAAAKAGLEARYLPVATGRVEDSDATAFGAAMRELPKPALAYCRSGARSTTLWALSQAPTMRAVERGKIVLAEFGYGGKLLPSFPSWLIDGTKPTRLAWLLKERLLPPIYWKAMQRGKEWLAKPEKVQVG